MPENQYVHPSRISSNPFGLYDHCLSEDRDRFFRPESIGLPHLEKAGCGAGPNWPVSRTTPSAARLNADASSIQPCYFEIPMDTHSLAPEVLPNEVWLMTFGLVGASEWKRLRLSCKHFNTLASSILFDTVSFELCGSSCSLLYNIASRPALSPCVKTLVLRRRQGCREFPDLETWIGGMHQPGDPGHFLAPADVVNQIDDDNLLPYSEWMALPNTQKETLYRKYEADREQAQGRVRDLTKRLRFRALGSPGGELVHSCRAFLSRPTDAVERLCKALEKLPNLAAFQHEPGFVFQEDWGCRWRSLRIHPWALLGNTDAHEDEDIEALQLSVVLQSLVWARQGQRRLRSLSVYIGGPAFWGPERLQHLWEGDGHELTRVCRTLHETAADADEEAYLDQGPTEQKGLYPGQLDLISQAFAGLTCLDCSISEDDERDGSLAIAAAYLLGFLRQAESLGRLRLVFGRLVDGILMPGDNESVYAQDSVALLARLARHTPWTKIRNIELEIATDRATLVAFLLAHKDTLRSLTLTRMTLVRLEDPLGSWEFTLNHIAEALSLQTLNVSILCDFVPLEAGKGTRQRILFDPEADLWRQKKSQYHVYYDTIVCRILDGCKVDSLDPEGD